MMLATYSPTRPKSRIVFQTASAGAGRTAFIEILAISDPFLGEPRTTALQPWHLGYCPSGISRHSSTGLHPWLPVVRGEATYTIPKAGGRFKERLKGKERELSYGKLLEFFDKNIPQGAPRAIRKSEIDDFSLVRGSVEFGLDPSRCLFAPIVGEQKLSGPLDRGLHIVGRAIENDLEVLLAIDLEEVENLTQFGLRPRLDFRFLAKPDARGRKPCHKNSHKKPLPGLGRTINRDTFYGLHLFST